MATFTRSDAADFLAEYEKDRAELAKLEADFKKATDALANHDIYSGSDYGIKEDAQTNALEAMMAHVEEMRLKYDKRGNVPKAAENKAGDIRQQIHFLGELEKVKLQACSALNAASSPPLDATEKRLLAVGESTSKDVFAKRRGGMTPDPNKLPKNTKQKDELSAMYHAALLAAVDRDIVYNQRIQREILAGASRESKYDRDVKSGINWFRGEFSDVEKIGVNPEKYKKGINRFLPRFIIDYVNEDMPHLMFRSERLGRFHANIPTSTYTTAAGEEKPLINPVNGKPLTGPSEYLRLGHVSQYGGYGPAAKVCWSANDRARMVQAGAAIGALFSNYVNNPAVLLDMKKIEAKFKNGEIKKDEYDGYVKAHKEAKDALATFKKEGITLNDVPPGYAGLDFYYQMKAQCEIMGIPMDPATPEVLFNRYISGGSSRTLRIASKYALRKWRERHVDDEKAAKARVEKFTMGTPEYKRLESAMVKSLVIKDLMADPTKKAAFEAFQDKFRNTHPELWDPVAKKPYNPDAYDKAFTRAFRSHFKSECKEKKQFVRKTEPYKSDLLKNGAGAHAAGERDWYRGLDKNNDVHMDPLNEEGDVSTDKFEEGSTPDTLKKMADEAALKISEDGEEPLPAIRIEEADATNDADEEVYNATLMIEEDEDLIIDSDDPSAPLNKKEPPHPQRRKHPLPDPVKNEQKKITNNADATRTAHIAVKLNTTSTTNPSQQTKATQTTSQTNNQTRTKPPTNPTNKKNTF